MGLWLGDDPKKNYDGVGPAPDPKDQAYTPEQLKARAYQAKQIGPNALAGVTGDSGARDAQRGALAQLQQRARGGLTAGDKSALYQGLGQAAQQNRGAQQAIMQQAASRGGVNSGSALAAQLSAQQAAGQQGADAAVKVAGDAADRAQGANLQAAQVGGALDQAAFQRQATIGQGQNQINAQNAQMGNDAARFNTQLEQMAQQFNIGNDVQAKQFLANLLQQQYQNKLGLASGLAQADASNNAANMALVQAIAGGAGSALGGYLAKSDGGTIPGTPKVEGDSRANDTVPAMLSPGEIVIPRSAVKSPDKIIAFLEQHTGLCFDNAVKSGQKPAKLKK